MENNELRMCLSYGVDISSNWTHQLLSDTPKPFKMCHFIDILLIYLVERAYQESSTMTKFGNKCASKISTFEDRVSRDHEVVSNPIGD